MSSAPDVQTEFSRPVSAENIGQRDQLHEIEATEAERAALARRFGLISVDAFRATIRLRRVSKGLIEARGSYQADVVQSCVVTLEPVPARLAEEFKVLYSTAPARPQREVIVAAEAEDPPEAVTGGQIDLGEAAVQQMALALDPYPRAPGAEMPAGGRDGSAAEEGRFNPFSVLSERRKRH
jgi:hypothetical protein